MSTTTREHVIAMRQRHHDALRAMAPANSRYSGIELWRLLRRVERRANAFALQLCNGPELTEAQQDAETEQITLRVAQIFGGTLPPGFFVNRDPRGYALKLQPGSVPFPLEQDWGGYQILAPEID